MYSIPEQLQRLRGIREQLEQSDLLSRDAVLLMADCCLAMGCDEGQLQYIFGFAYWMVIEVEIDIQGLEGLINGRENS